MHLGDFLSTLTNYNKTLDPDKMMLGATKIDITRKQIAVYEKEYEENPNDEIFKIAWA